MSKLSKHNLRDLKADKTLNSFSNQLIENGVNTSKKKGTSTTKLYIPKKDHVFNVMSKVSNHNKKNSKIIRANQPPFEMIGPSVAHSPGNNTRKLQNCEQRPQPIGEERRPSPNTISRGRGHTMERYPEHKSLLYQSAQVYRVSLSNPDVRAGNGELLFDEDSKENWMTFPDIKWRNAMSDESLFVALTEDGRSFSGYSSSEDFLLDAEPTCSSYIRLRETGGIALQTTFIASGVSIIDKSMKKIKSYGKRLAKLRIREIRPTLSVVSTALPEVISFEQQTESMSGSNTSIGPVRTKHHHRHDHHHYHHHNNDEQADKSETGSADNDDNNDDTSSSHTSSDDQEKSHVKSSIKRIDLKDSHDCQDNHENDHQRDREYDNINSEEDVRKREEAIKSKIASGLPLVVSNEIQTESPKCTHHFHRRRRHIDPRYEDFLRHYYQHHEPKYRGVGVRHHRHHEFHYNVAQMKVAEGMQTHKSHLHQHLLHDHRHHQRHHVTRHHRPQSNPKTNEDRHHVHRTHHHHHHHHHTKHKHQHPKPISTKSPEEKKSSTVQFKKQLVEEKQIPNTASVTTLNDVPKESIEKIKNLVKKWKNKKYKTLGMKGHQVENIGETKHNEKKDNKEKENEKTDNKKKETVEDLKSKVPKKPTGKPINEIPENKDRRNSDGEILKEIKKNISGDETFEEKKERLNSGDEIVEEKKVKSSTAYEQIQQVYPRFPEEVSVPLSEVRLPDSETSNTSLRDSIKALLKRGNRSGIKTVFKLWSVTQYQPHLWSRCENAQPRYISSSYENFDFRPSDQFVEPSIDNYYMQVDAGVQNDESQFTKRITKFDILEHPKRCTKYAQQRPTLNEVLLAVEDLDQTREASAQSRQLHRMFCRSKAVSTQTRILLPLLNLASTQSILITHVQRKSKIGKCHVKPRKNVYESNKQNIGIRNLKEVSGKMFLPDKLFLLKSSHEPKERFPHYLLKNEKPALYDVNESNLVKHDIIKNIGIGEHNANLHVDSMERFGQICPCKQHNCFCNKKVDKDQNLDKNYVNVNIKSKNYAQQPQRFNDVNDLECIKLMNKGTTFSNEKLVNSDSSNLLRTPVNGQLGCCKIQLKEKRNFKKNHKQDKCTTPFFDKRIIRKQKNVSQQPCFPKLLTTRNVSYEQNSRIFYNPYKYHNYNINSERNYSKSLQKQTKSINTELLHSDSLRNIRQKYVYKTNSDCCLSKHSIVTQTTDNWYCCCMLERKDMCIPKKCRNLSTRSCECLTKRNWATENMCMGTPNHLFKAFENTFKYPGCYNKDVQKNYLGKCLQVTESICAYVPIKSCDGKLNKIYKQSISCEFASKRRNVNKHKKKEKKKKGVHCQSPPIIYRPQFRNLCLCNNPPETRCKDRLCNQQNIFKNNVDATVAMVDCPSAIYSSEELGEKYIKNNLQVTKTTIVECPSSNKYSEELKKLCLCKHLQKPIYLEPKCHNCFWEQQETVYKNDKEFTKKKHVVGQYPIAIINTAEDRNNGFCGESREPKKYINEPKENNTFKRQNNENVALHCIENLSESKFYRRRKSSTMNTLCKQSPVIDFTRIENQFASCTSNNFRKKITTYRQNSNDKIIDDEKVIAYHNFEHFTDPPSKLKNKILTSIGGRAISLESSKLSALSRVDHFYRTVSDICDNFRWLKKRASRRVPFSIQIPKLTQSKIMVKLLSFKKCPPTLCTELPTLSSSKQSEYKISHEFDYNKNTQLAYSDYKHVRKLQKVNTDQNHNENENVLLEHDTMLPPNIKFESLRRLSVGNFLSHQHLPLYNGPVNRCTNLYEYDKFYDDFEQPTYITPSKYKFGFRYDEYNINEDNDNSEYSYDSDDCDYCNDCDDCYDDYVKRFKRLNCAQTQSEQGYNLQDTKKVSCQCPVRWTLNRNYLCGHPPGINDIFIKKHERLHKKHKHQRNLTKCPATCKFDHLNTQPKQCASLNGIHVYVKDGLEFQTSLKNNLTKIASKLSNCLKGNPRSKVLVLKRRDCNHHLPAYFKLGQLKNMCFKKLSSANLGNCHYKKRARYQTDDSHECFCKQQVDLFQPVADSHIFTRRSKTTNDQVYYFEQWYDIQHKKSNTLLCPDDVNMAHQNRQVIKSESSAGIRQQNKIKLINDLNTDRELEQSPENMGSLSLLNNSAFSTRPQPKSEIQPVNEKLRNYQLQRFERHKETTNKYNCDYNMKKNYLDSQNTQHVQHPKNEIKLSETQVNDMQTLEEHKNHMEITNYNTCNCNVNKVKPIEVLDTYRELKQIIKLKGGNCSQKILELENIFLRPQSTNKTKNFNGIGSGHSRLHIKEDDKSCDLMQSSSILCLEEPKKRYKCKRKKSCECGLKGYLKTQNRCSLPKEQLGPNCTCTKPNIRNDGYTQLQKHTFKQQLNSCESQQPTLSNNCRKCACLTFKNGAMQAIGPERKDVTTSKCIQGFEISTQCSRKNLSIFTNTSVEILYKSNKKVNRASQYKYQDRCLKTTKKTKLKEKYSSTGKCSDSCNQTPEASFIYTKNKIEQPLKDKTSYYIPKYGSNTVHKNHKCIQNEQICPISLDKSIAISTSFCKQESVKCSKYSGEEPFNAIKIKNRYSLQLPEAAIHRKITVGCPTVSPESSDKEATSCKQVSAGCSRPKYYLEKGCPGQPPQVVHKKDKRLQTRNICPVVSREYFGKVRSLCKRESRKCITSKCNLEKGSVNVIKMQHKCPIQPMCVVYKKNRPIQATSSMMSHRNCSIQNTLCKPEIHKCMNPKYVSNKLTGQCNTKLQNCSQADFTCTNTGTNLNNKRSKQNRFCRRKPSLVLTCPEDNLESLYDNDYQPLRLTCKMKRLSKPEMPIRYCDCGRGNRKRRNKSKKSSCECSIPKRKRFKFMHRKKWSKVRAAEKEIEGMLKNRPSQSSCRCNIINESTFNGSDCAHHQCQTKKKKFLTPEEELDVITLKKRHPSLFLICPK